ncbi:MAG: hypothetical protein NTY10_00715 [Candidatus Omnitrophica bacterium]|nr:hypothetical protein [Candidatus Omnitrophota bacterium]
MLKHKIWRLSGILALFCIFSVVEANAVPNDITTSKYWSEWVNATSAPSVNLALGKPYAFSVIPMYKLTHYTDGNGTTDKSTTDTTDLTDGAYATTYYNNETIWFNHEAIGWDWEGGGTTDNTGVNIKIDLGVNPVDPVKGYPVDRVVFRVLGGGSQGSIFAPRRIEVFVSKDGINFYKTDAIEKLQSTESALNGTVNPVDGTRYFWLDESNVVNNSFIYNGLTGTTIDATTGAWVYPFILNVQANTRYVGVRVYGATDMVVADELAVMSSLANPAGLDGIYTSGTPESFVAQGITVKPPLDKLVISTNITTPNMLGIHDVRGYLTKSNTANLVMELPEGISLITTPSPLVSPQIMQQQSLVRPSGQKYTKITITPLKDWSGRTSTQPFFFKAETDFPKPGVIPEAVFYSECAGEVTFPQVVPVELITIPVVTPRLDRLHISLGWMGHEEVNAWPDFFTATAPSLPAWQTLGFNFVSGFPYWDRGSLPGQVRANARQYGFKILMQDSPIHRMTESHNWDPKTGYAKAGDEIYSQVPTGDSLNVCPSYVGQWYVQEVARVGLEVKKSN